MTRTLLAAALLSLTVPARAQELPVRFQPVPEFEDLVRGGVGAFAPKDAFSSAACRVVDARTLRPYTFDAAARAVSPCLASLSKTYGVTLSVKPGIVAVDAEGRATVGLLLVPGRGAAVGTAALRDLNHSLALRRDYLMGYRAALRREGETGPQVVSSVQTAVERCILPAVVRKIRNAGEFLGHYGPCLLKDAELKAKDLAPLGGGDPLAVGITAEAEEPALKSMNGLVTVMGESGPVQLLFAAFPAPAQAP